MNRLENLQDTLLQMTEGGNITDRDLSLKLPHPDSARRYNDPLLLRWNPPGRRRHDGFGQIGNI